jgi:Fe-S oxidoreductase
MDNESIVESITGKCIKCGFCESVCPTYKSSNYDPFYGARGRVILANSITKEEKLDAGVTDSFYSCLDCYACIDICPVGINAGVVSELMKNIIVAKKPSIEKPLANLIKNSIIKYQNPLGLKKECAEWSNGIEFNDCGTLLFTGHMYQMMAYSTMMNRIRKYLDGKVELSMVKAFNKNIGVIGLSRHFYDRNVKARMDSYLKNIVYLLKKSGVRFNYLKEDEPYPGMFLYDLGYIDELKEYARKVYSILKSKNVKRIIAIDPHTYDILKNKYPEYIENFDIEIIYYTDLLDLKFKKSSEKVAFQVPCLMDMHKNTYNGMAILKEITGDKTSYDGGKYPKCCGGPDELLYHEISKNVSINRFKDLKKQGNKIITMCPLCNNNLHYDNNVIDFSEFMLKLIE